MFVIKTLFIQCIAFNFLFVSISSQESDMSEERRTKHEILPMYTETGKLANAIAQIPSIPIENGHRFRTACKTGDRCVRPLRKLMVPQLAQLENAIMEVMKDLSSMSPGERVPNKMTKTEPFRLMLDGEYMEPACEADHETCVREDRRRRRILKKLFLRKYSDMRQKLIGYGGRGLWGGEANLFYR